MTWRPLRTAPDDIEPVHLWFESDGRSYPYWNGGKPHESFATPGKWDAAWQAAAGPYNRLPSSPA